MSSKNKEDPLAIKVQCKNCGHVQNYCGQIPCDLCKQSGSLQLIGGRHDFTDEPPLLSNRSPQ